MRKYIALFCIILFGVNSFAQDSTGAIAGKILDKEYNNEPLPFANVLLLNTTKGTTTDNDGLYVIDGLQPGTYTVEFSYTGYETITIPNVEVVAGKVTEVNTSMGATAATLDEVTITTVARRDSEVALLLDQKGAVNIKESIGAEQLSNLGVRNVSDATTKIAGVSKSDGAGQIYVRGLGDRYLTTTLNGLPVPSDNIDKKNIDLDLIPTRFIENVSISKTFSPNQSADQASGNINVETHVISERRDFAVGIRTGVNTNTMGVYDDYRVTAMNDDISLGIYSRAYQNSNLQDALTEQTWNAQDLSNPINYSFGFNAGGFLDEDGKFRLYFSGGQSIENEYREGLFREFDQGQLNDVIPDGDNRFWRRTVNTNGLLTAQYKINDNNRLTFNSMAINKVFQETYEAGRSGEAIIFEELQPVTRGNQFIRDQNIKNTFLLINQFLGSHTLSEKNELNWGAAYNRSEANEPNRIRNEVNIMNEDPSQGIEDGDIQLGNTGGFQQSKRSQEILDTEFAANIIDAINLKEDEVGDVVYKLSFGGDFRNKVRDFASIVQGLDDNSGSTLNPPSIDDISAVLTQENVDSGLLIVNEIRDNYDADLTSYAGFVDFVGVFGDFTLGLGLRYQSDAINIDYDVNNAPGGRIGSAEQSYQRLYPSLNVKYELDERSALRLSGSLSQTLPEFKEIAPFEYVSPLNQIISGNRFIEASRNLNIDLKYEFFPTNDQLISVATFYKNIEDPINMSLRLGGEDIFSFFNTSDNARVFGVEVEGRFNLLPVEVDLPQLKLAGNVSYINHKQDLRDETSGRGVNGQARTFQYRGIDEIGLQGASDWTTNLSLTYDTNTEKAFRATVAGNYASDRIFALGAPRNQNDTDNFFNGEIIEQGVVVLDLVLSKEINDKLTIGATGKNLLNPEIKRFQKVSAEPGTSAATVDETILTYTRGAIFTLNLNYKF